MTKPLTTPAQEYIHLPSIGDFEKSKASIEQIDEALKPRLNNGQIVGYHLILISNEDDIEAHFIETNYTSVTNGTFPFAYIFIQPDEEYQQLEEIANKLDLQRL